MRSIAKDISTEEKIHRAAFKEFAQYGFDGARVDRIAQKAKINKAMIYYHYKGKEALYETILKSVYGDLYNTILDKVNTEDDPEEQLYSMISSLMDFYKDGNQEFIRIMLRELSSGGKYFKKLFLPNVIIPMISTVQSIFAKGKEKGTFKNLNPGYTFIQTVGSVVFFNAIKLVLAETDLGKVLFHEAHYDDFKDNLLEVLRHGILTSRGSHKND